MSLIECPMCKKRIVSDVVDSRGNSIGIRRRRQCVLGHRFATIEVPWDFYSNLEASFRAYSRAEATLESILDDFRCTKNTGAFERKTLPTYDAAIHKCVDGSESKEHYINSCRKCKADYRRKRRASGKS